MVVYLPIASIVPQKSDTGNLPGVYIMTVFCRIFGRLFGLIIDAVGRPDFSDEIRLMLRINSNTNIN